MPPELRIRPAVRADLPALAELYEVSVRTLGPERYTPDQVAAWAAFAREEAFEAFLGEGHTVLDEARARSLPRLYAEASEFSRPVFERAGFEVAEVERVVRRGVAFTRWKMVPEPLPPT